MAYGRGSFDEKMQIQWELAKPKSHEEELAFLAVQQCPKQAILWIQARAYHDPEGPMSDKICHRLV